MNGGCPLPCQQAIDDAVGYLIVESFLMENTGRFLLWIDDKNAKNVFFFEESHDTLNAIKFMFE
jgi:hypothetical protein